MALGTPVLRDSADASDEIFCAVLEIPGDSAYPTGGTLAVATKVAAALATLKKGAVNVLSITGSAVGYVVLYNAASDKLLVLDGTLAQVANTTDLSATTFFLTVLYK